MSERYDAPRENMGEVFAKRASRAANAIGWFAGCVAKTRRRYISEGTLYAQSNAEACLRRRSRRRRIDPIRRFLAGETGPARAGLRTTMAMPAY